MKISDIKTVGDLDEYICSLKIPLECITNHGWMYGQQITFYWDIEDILEYDIVEEEDKDDDTIYPFVKVKLKDRTEWVHIKNIRTKIPEAKSIIRELIKGIEEWASNEDGIPDLIWKPYVNAKKLIEPNWKEPDDRV